MSVDILNPRSLCEEFNTPLNGNIYGKLYGQLYITQHGKPVLRCCVCLAEHRFYRKFMDHIHEHRANTEHTEECIKIEENEKETLQSIRMGDIQLPEQPISNIDVYLKQESLSPLREAPDEIDRLLNVTPFLCEEPFLTNSDKEEYDALHSQSSSDSEESVPPPKRPRTKRKKSERFNCDQCKQTFAKASTLELHCRKRHLTKDKKPINLQCSICDRKFNRNCNLQKHVRSHSRERSIRSFICKCCGRSFSSAKSCSVHERTYENQRLNIRPYKCKFCEKAFFAGSKLYEHLKTHNRVRKYACKVCEKAFYQSKHLSAHMKIHKNARGYVCGICGRDFNQHASLYIHMRSAHNVVTGTVGKQSTIRDENGE